MTGFKPFDADAVDKAVIRDRTPSFCIDGQLASQKAAHGPALELSDLPPPVSVFVSRHWLNPGGIQAAAALLTRLPIDGEAIHGILGARAFSAWDLVVGILELAACPAQISVSTLSTNLRNAKAMLGMFDEGRLTAISYLSSRLMRDKTADVYAALKDGLSARGQRLSVGRNHAKVVTFWFADGRKMSLETSANMRTGSTLEQFAVIHHAGLHDFHANWIDSEIEKGAVK